MSTTDSSKKIDTQYSGYEKSDVPAIWVVYAALALFMGVGASAAFVLGILVVSAPEGAKQYKPALEAEQMPSSSPWLELDPESDRARIEAAATKKLHGFQWIDRRNGIVQIPIERAMRMLADQGWPGTSETGRTR
jgi:hypothetical protein